jgi:hypothetical protein
LFRPHLKIPWNPAIALDAQGQEASGDGTDVTLVLNNVCLKVWRLLHLQQQETKESLFKEKLYKDKVKEEKVSPCNS